MTGVTWRELPADAPEPPPLSVVRDKDGDIWVHVGHGEEAWRCSGGGTEAAGSVAGWPSVSSYGPVQIAEDADAYAPWPAPHELVVEPVEPTEFEIRLEALKAAALLCSTDAARALAIASQFEPYLRGDLLAQQNGDD